MISTRPLVQTDGPILLRPKPTKWLLVALGSLAFVLIGIWMVRSRDMFGWLAIAFFGLCLAVSLICLLPKASYLRLTPDGFTMCSLFRAHTIRWEDVTGFGVGRVFTNKMVMFNYVESYQRTPKLRWIKRSSQDLKLAYRTRMGSGMRISQTCSIDTRR